MIEPVVLDAGPALNFFATHNERLLLSVVGGKVSAPETVAAEVARRGSRDTRFTAAPAVWQKLKRAHRLHILSDDVTPELSKATQRITGTPLAERKAKAADLGETMVVAHAAVLAEAGRHVTVLIDDRGGAELATREMRRLERLRTSRPGLGTIRLGRTIAVLESAIGGPFIPNRQTMRRIYEALRSCDDGLVDISQTHLLSRALWETAP